MKSNWTVIFFFFLGLIFSKSVSAENAAPDDIINRYGLAVIGGQSYYHSNDVGFFMLSGFALYDYDRIWPHPAPELLRFKVECSAGITNRPKNRFVASVGMLALYYLDRFAYNRLRPYLEGGIGIIYTDFQLWKQGLRVNFNPQVGVGTEFNTGAGGSFFAAVRLHHISNGGLHHDNNGIDTLIILFGRYF